MITRQHVEQLVNGLTVAAMIVERDGNDALRAGNRGVYDNAQRMVTNWRALIDEVNAALSALPQDGASADPTMFFLG